MRIAFLTSEFPVLSETPFLNQITGLVRRGHELDIFADKPQPDVPPHPDIERLELMARTRYPMTLPREGRWVAAARMVTSHHGAERLALLRSLNPLAFWRRAWSLEQLRRSAAFLPRRHYDICYCAFGQDAVKAARTRRTGALDGKLVVAFRGADTTKYVARRGPRTYARTFATGALFLPVSEAFARRIIALGAPPEKVMVHRTGIDPRRWTFRARARRSGEPLRVLTVARLVEKKGIAYVLAALRRLIDDGESVVYDVVGDGPLRSRLVAERDRLGLAEQVRLHGWRTQAQVRELVDAAHVLVAASVVAANADEEGIPNVLKEAMASGLPVLATRHGGIPELVEDGVSGFLVPERDVGALAERMRHLAAHPETWPALGSAGRAKVEREYDIERLNDRLVELFEAVRG